MLGRIKRAALKKATRDSKAASAKASEDGFPILAELHQNAADDTMNRPTRRRR